MGTRLFVTDLVVLLQETQFTLLVMEGPVMVLSQIAKTWGLLLVVFIAILSQWTVLVCHSMSHILLYPL